MAKGIKKSDSENKRTSQSRIPVNFSQLDDQQIDILKTFKGSTPMYHEEAKQYNSRPVRQEYERPKPGKGA